MFPSEAGRDAPEPAARSSFSSSFLAKSASEQMQNWAAGNYMAGRPERGWNFAIWPAKPLILLDDENSSPESTNTPKTSRIIAAIALAGTRVMNRMRVEGGRRWVGRMTVCGLG